MRPSWMPPRGDERSADPKLCNSGGANGMSERQEDPGIDVMERVIERQRLLMVALNHRSTDEERREALLRALSDDPFKEPQNV